jgi:hypothetical protein
MFPGKRQFEPKALDGLRDWTVGHSVSICLKLLLGIGMEFSFSNGKVSRKLCLLITIQKDQRADLSTPIRGLCCFI